MAKLSKVLILVVVVLAGCAAFKQPSFSRNNVIQARPSTLFAPLRMVDEESSMVTIDKESVEVSAGFAGLIAGALVGGPFVGVVLALASNYLSKQETEVGDVARGVGKASLEIFNFFAKVANKYNLGDKVGQATESALNKLKEYDGDAQVVSKIEETLKTTSEKLAELDKEYDLKAKTGDVLKKASDLNTQAFKKAEELNKEYKLTDKLSETVSKAVEEAKKSQ